MVTYFTLQIALVIVLFTNCYISQLLIDEVYWLLQTEFPLKWQYYDFHCKIFSYQINAVKTISNTLDWYQLPVKKTRCLTLMIIMSNKPMKVTVANMVQLSLVTFTDVSTSNTDVFKSLRKEFYEKNICIKFFQTTRLCLYRSSETIVEQHEKVCLEKLKFGFENT